MIFIAGVLMCVPNVRKAFEHLLTSCNEIWIQDVVRAHRAGANECGGDVGNADFNDINRFAFSKHDEMPRASNAVIFDMDEFELVSVDSVYFYSDYGAGKDPNSPDYKDSRKFVARLIKR